LSRRTCCALSVILSLSTLPGCNLVFGVGEPELVRSAGGEAQGIGGDAGGLSGGAGGAGGDGGADVEPPNPCVGKICEDENPCTGGTCDEFGDCVSVPIARPTASLDAPGDCRVPVCEQGTLGFEVDPTDVPPPSTNPCADRVCSAEGDVVDVPKTPQPPETTVSCGAGGECQGLLCSVCDVASDCGTNTECAVYECESNACDLVFFPAGTIASSQVAGDCKRLECTGDAPQPLSVPLDSDVLDDGNECTSDTCAGGVPLSMGMTGATCLLGDTDFGRCLETLCVECVEDVDCVDDIKAPVCNFDTNVCGCAASEQCMGALAGSVCYDGLCGCKLDSDCKNVGVIGPYCNPETLRCQTTKPVMTTPGGAQPAD
jgi:hypothetical protein